MRNPPHPILSIVRCRQGTYATTDEDGNNGAFLLHSPNGATLKVIANEACEESDGWEHVSVSIHAVARCPIWQEMCFVKEIFWEDDEVVVQFHPAKKDYVNFHPFCLHMWRHVSGLQPTPPTNLVGPKKMEFRS